MPVGQRLGTSALCVHKKSHLVHLKCTSSAQNLDVWVVDVHFKMYKCTKIRDYFREHVFSNFPQYFSYFPEKYFWKNKRKLEKYGKILGKNRKKMSKRFP